MPAARVAAGGRPSGHLELAQLAERQSGPFVDVVLLLGEHVPRQRGQLRCHGHHGDLPAAALLDPLRNARGARGSASLRWPPRRARAERQPSPALRCGRGGPARTQTTERGGPGRRSRPCAAATEIVARSPTQDISVTAVIMPTPGIVINRRTCSSRAHRRPGPRRLCRPDNTNCDGRDQYATELSSPQHPECSLHRQRQF